MESSKHDWMLSDTATPLQFFFLKILFLSAKIFQFMNCSEAKFYENYWTSDFHIQTLLFQDVFALVPIKMASKTMTRSSCHLSPE